MKLLDSLFEKEKIDTTNWKEFKIGDILNRVKIKSISKIIRNFNEGNINIVGNSLSNNGIIKSLNINQNIYIHSGNSISYGAKGGGFFYQKNEWASTDHVHMFVNENLNEYNSLFLCTIINKIIFSKGGWSSSLESNIIYEKIKLPVKSDGSPNWEYMEEYIKYIYIYISNNIYKIIYLLFEKTKIDTNNWKEFKISELFEVYSSKNSLDQNKILKDINLENKYNYITRTNNNNGIHSKICKQLEEINLGNCLTIGLDTQTVFYQSDPFYTGQNIHILRMKNGNKNKYLFISTILKRKIKEIYYWGSNGITLGRLIVEKIKLPVTNNGDPDWEYMDEYIKSLPYSKYL